MGEKAVWHLELGNRTKAAYKYNTLTVIAFVMWAIAIWDQCNKINSWNIEIIPTVMLRKYITRIIGSYLTFGEVIGTLITNGSLQ
jgi:hypothetical protein